MRATPPIENRAYSVLTVKAVDGEQRTITGTATTPTPDRVNDIIEPLGVKFKNPLPLLLYHDSRKPVGTVKFDTPTAEGITFTAHIPEILEPGVLKERVDEAWQSVKARLLRGVSIGFRALNDAVDFMQDTGGFRFKETEVLELSLVAIPANMDATIASIKSFDTPFQAAPHGDEPSNPNTPNHQGTPVVRLLPSRQEKQMKTISELITSWKSTRDQKWTEMNELMSKSAETGLSLNPEESDKYDAAKAEVKAADVHIARLEEMESFQKSAAKPVSGGDPHAAHASRGGDHVPTVQIKSNLPPGIEFAMAMVCKAQALNYGGYAADYAKQLFPDRDRVQAFLKAAVPAATTTHTTYAAPLVDPTNLSAEFIEYLRPSTILGKFGTNGIPSLRRVPFNVRMAGQTSGGDAYWVGEGAPKPLTKFDFNAQTLTITKIASISVLTDELIRLASPNALDLIRDGLRDANVERSDIDFIDPTVAAVAGVSPASITNGVTPLSPSGTTADAARADYARIVKAYLDANNRPRGLVIIMPDALALSLSVMVNTLGQREFPDLTMEGGRLLGVPVITSQYAANQSGSGNLLIAVNAPDVFLADDGGVDIAMSREASLQMLDNPTNSSSTATPTTMVSMFQTNSVAVRAERHINWAKRRAGAAVFMDDVNWGSIGSPA